MKAARERVYVVDDEPAVRKSLERLLRSAGYDVEAFSGPDDFLRGLTADAAGCAILDVFMPGLDGLALQQALAGRGIELAVVFLTGHGDVPRTVRAMKAGATDFLTKPVDDEVLLSAVRQGLVRSRAAREQREELAGVRARLATLTGREREVLEGVVAGRLNKQIAGDLGIAEKTVKVHRGRVMEKMGVPSLAELVRLADHAGIRRPANRRLPEEPAG